MKDLVSFLSAILALAILFTSTAQAGPLKDLVTPKKAEVKIQINNGAAGNTGVAQQIKVQTAKGEKVVLQVNNGFVPVTTQGLSHFQHVSANSLGFNGFGFSPAFHQFGFTTNGFGFVPLGFDGVHYHLGQFDKVPVSEFQFNAAPSVQFATPLVFPSFSVGASCPAGFSSNSTLGVFFGQ